MESALLTLLPSAGFLARIVMYGCWSPMMAGKRAVSSAGLSDCAMVSQTRVVMRRASAGPGRVLDRAVAGMAGLRDLCVNGRSRAVSEKGRKSA